MYALCMVTVTYRGSRQKNSSLCSLPCGKTGCLLLWMFLNTVALLLQQQLDWCVHAYNLLSLYTHFIIIISWVLLWPCGLVGYPFGVNWRALNFYWRAISFFSVQKVFLFYFRYLYAFIRRLFTHLYQSESHFNYKTMDLYNLWQTVFHRYRRILMNYSFHLHSWCFSYSTYLLIRS